MIQLSKNIRPIERGIRSLVGLLLIYLGFIDTSMIPDALFSFLVGMFGVANLTSGLLGWCPMYHLTRTTASDGE
ncbi:MAG: DUF2892 domain-containing protein [Thiohalophilus sp.]|uniref:YgaP family membrane protein n=1 Tax=Thiohalophilus sp. TaxID=3028392 RepID=UPI0028709E60|nr:DUF2892 domain-containing protein [Thiohalophilus sp.]MDR9435953.1 DUF2892 domain-containing protein [Thiohalophilus sp.]